MTDKKARSPLQPPAKGHPDDRARVPIEAALSLAPGGSALVKLAAEHFPTQSQRSRSAWEKDVSSITNEHDERLDAHDRILSPTHAITGTAASLAAALARAPGDGMRGRPRNLHDLCDLLPDCEPANIEDAAFELADFGLVDIKRAIGKGNWWIQLPQQFYEQIDHQVMDWNSNTHDDARRLAELLLEDNGRQRTSVLQLASGWEKRRFNPAFRALLHYVLVYSNEIQADYPSSSVVLTSDDRARLRRLIAPAS
jgi:hypothetical protein